MSSIVDIKVTRGEHVSITNTNKSTNLLTYSIKFGSKVIDVLYDERYNIYALKDTFQRVSTSISPTSNTKWFVSIVKCLQSVKDGGFPQDDTFLENVSKQIREIPVVIDYIQDNYD